MNWLCEGKSIFTSKEIKANYIPYTYAMITTNCDNFEIFGSPCHQLNIDLPSINNPSICALLAKMSTPSLLHPLLFGAKEYQGDQAEGLVKMKIICREKN